MKSVYRSSERGNLIVISGPSGSGKSTIVSKLLENNDKCWLSISCTSRNMRPGDEEGKTYYFLSKKEFETKIENEEFLEYAVYNSNYYGTPKKYIEEKLKSGIDVILEIEVQGALKIKQQMPETIFIFIMPPSMSVLAKRLIGRKSENKDAIVQRFKTAYQEINKVTDYNYVVVNDEVETAVNKINSILTAAKCSVERIEQLYLNNEEEEVHELLMDENFDNNDIKIS